LAGLNNASALAASAPHQIDFSLPAKRFRQTEPCHSAFWQALRFHELNPNWQALDEESSQWGLFTKPGQRLQWQMELPLIVLGHGRPIQGPKKVSEATALGRERIWRAQRVRHAPPKGIETSSRRTPLCACFSKELQEDLAKRSTHGEFRVADKSAHSIHLDQPELVIQAIREVLQK
jgi:pimeloyl-ACP methyl ester carboxylesterase